MLKSLGVTIAQVTDRLRKNPDVARAGRDYESPEAAVQAAERKRRMRTVFWLVATFVGMVAIFSTLFHELMARRPLLLWPTSVYWTLTTMTTLGFGDITFESDAGRIFSVVVLLAGSTFLLVMLPFVFIQFVFVPWMNERTVAGRPRRCPNRSDATSSSRSPAPSNSPSPTAPSRPACRT
ncbi:MAG: potassium channel family protein [Ilumatobacteraceae bacterium]